MTALTQNTGATETTDRDSAGDPQPVAGSASRSSGQRVTIAIDALLLLASLAYIADPEDPAVDSTSFVVTSLGWTVVAACYAGIRVSRVRRARRGDERWPQRLAGRRTSYLITLSTALILFGAGLNIATAEGPEGTVAVVKGLSVVMVLLAWAILHLSYAERYARLYLDGGDVPMSFPETPAPTLLEFVYFSFAIGTTFATSDVEIRTTRARGIVLSHGLLAFVYNTAIISMVVGLLTGNSS